MVMPYSGQLGLVLFLDEDTRNIACALARQIQPNNLDLCDQRMPHLTLYHSRLSGVPVETVERLLRTILASFPVTARLEAIGAYADKFIFWHVAKNDGLLELHKCALELSRFFIPGAIEQADREGLTLPAEQEKNVRRFGHPLILDSWSPHVTLAYHASGYPKFGQRILARDVFFTGAAFVEIGNYGTIARHIVVAFC